MNAPSQTLIAAGAAPLTMADIHAALVKLRTQTLAMREALARIHQHSQTVLDAVGDLASRVEFENLLLGFDDGPVPAPTPTMHIVEDTPPAPAPKGKRKREPAPVTEAYRVGSQYVSKSAVRALKKCGVVIPDGVLQEVELP
jgi:hypothetical protein